MKKKYAILLMLILSSLAFGKTVKQDDLQTRNGVAYLVNHKEPYTGYVLWKSDIYESMLTYNKKPVSVKVFLKNGKIDGTITTMIDKYTKQKITFKQGKKNGKELKYYKNKLISSISYVNDLKNGPFIHYYSNGKLFEKGTWKNDKLNGYYESYFKNGQLNEKSNYSDGKLSGHYESYTRNGELLKKGVYKINKSNDPYHPYIAVGNWIINTYEYGSLVTSYKGTLINNGCNSGVHKEYNENNQLTYVKTFKNEQCIEKTIYKNGKIDTEERFNENGKKDGTWRKYKNDKIVTEKTYKDGTPYDGIFKIEEPNSTTKYSIETYKNGEKCGTWEDYDGKQLIAKYKFVNNQITGNVIEYYSNGNLKGEETFKKGKLDGNIKTYSEQKNKQLVSEYTIRNNIKDGAFKKYYYNGNISVEGTFKEDKLDGEVIIYNQDKSIKEKNIYKNGVKQKNTLEKTKSAINFLSKFQ